MLDKTIGENMVWAPSTVPVGKGVRYMVMQTWFNVCLHTDIAGWLNSRQRRDIKTPKRSLSCLELPITLFYLLFQALLTVWRKGMTVYKSGEEGNSFSTEFQFNRHPNVRFCVDCSRPKKNNKTKIRGAPFFVKLKQTTKGWQNQSVLNCKCTRGTKVNKTSKI